MLFGEQLLNNEEDVGLNPQVSEGQCSKKYALSCHLCLADSKYVTIIAVHFCFGYTVLDWFLLLSSLLLDYFEDFTSCCFE